MKIKPGTTILAHGHYVLLIFLGVYVSILSHHFTNGYKYETRQAMQEAFIEAKEPSGILHSSDWYDTWAADLLGRIEDIFSALKTRPVQPLPSPLSWMSSSDTFRVAMIGDSTMRMQADALFALLSGITTETGERPCPCTTNEEPCLCSGYGDGKNRNGSTLLRIDYYHVTEACVVSNVVANFVYFGCGLHILQRQLTWPISQASLQSWTQYEKILEKSVLAYRSSGSARGGYLGEAFMTTHSIILEKMEDPMLGEILAYARGDARALSHCYERVNELKRYMTELVFDIPPEDICTRGYFADTCVVALNKRGKAVMRRLGVPIVPSYEITLNQHWATPKRDGRHYVPLIPQELANFLGIIGMALREERLPV